MGSCFSPEIETAPRERLREIQESRLPAQMRYLHEHSPLMHEKLQRAGVAPEDVRKIPDLAHLPFTTKEELRESQAISPPLGRHAAAASGIVRVHASSGTTGTPS